jgi:hypothetical protein
MNASRHFMTPSTPDAQRKYRDELRAQRNNMRQDCANKAPIIRR